MPIKGNRGANLNQPQEYGRKDTQRTVDAWPEMDPNRPADSQTTGRESRAGSSIRTNGSARRQAPLKSHLRPNKAGVSTRRSK